MYPYYKSGNEDSQSVTFWTNLHNRLSRELGLQELSKQWFSYTENWNGSDRPRTIKHTMVKVCENWLMQTVVGSPDEHIKERLSLVELGFREREREINALDAQYNLNSAIRRIPLSSVDLTRAHQLRAERTEKFRASADELNARFRQAKYALNYHNGFIQILTDDLVQREVETPFWTLVASQEWANVDQDMKEALDLRDSGGRDPAFVAARALESTIKIISDRKNWTHGSERGAHNYIDNLAAKANAFVMPWESESLKNFFTHVRNPLGHGAGSAEMPSLSRAQTEWAIEFSMIWIKSLIHRL